MRYLLLVIPALIFLSCKVSDINQIGKIENNTEIVHGKVEIPQVTIHDGDTVRVTRVIDYNFFNCKQVYCDSVNARIVEFVRKNTAFEPEKGPVSMGRSFFQQQLNYFDSLAREEEQLSEDMPPWELDLSTAISKKDGYIDLGLSVWSYTGGAHGNGFYVNVLIDTATGEELLLSDFITDVQAFTTFAEKYFRKQNNIQPQEDLGELGFWFQDNKFSLNENFHFTDENMVFFYNSYEIAPYSAGQIELFIPIKDMESFLKIQP